MGDKTKTLTIDYELYQEELRESFRKGIKKAYQDATMVLKTIRDEGDIDAIMQQLYEHEPSMTEMHFVTVASGIVRPKRGNQ